MSMDILLVLIGWLLALAIFFGFIVLLRYLHHRELIVLLNHGINPDRLHRQRRSRRMLRGGLIVMMVGLALTVGLYPVGFLLPVEFARAPFNLGPWLLPGLIPLGVGFALIVSYYLEQSTLADPRENDDKDKIIPLDERREKQRESH